MSQSNQHGIYLSGLFEVEEKTSPENGWRSEWRTYAMSICAGGADRQHRLSYDIQAKAFSAAQFRLWAGNVYFLRRAFYPSNTPHTKKDLFIFEGSEAVLLAQAEDFLGDTVDSIGVTGIGMVTNVKTKVEECCQGMKKAGAPDDPLTTVVTVQHSEYHPSMKGPSASTVEYLIRPTPNLAGIASIIRAGRECRIHGFIKDFNEETNCYVVIANKVYLTDTFGESDNKTKSKSGVPDSASKKPAKFKPNSTASPFKSPYTASTSTDKAAFETNDFTPETSFSTASSVIGSTSKIPMNPEFDSLESLPAAPPKKKACSQPKRKASNPAPVDSP